MSVAANGARSRGHPAKLAYWGHVLTEKRDALVVDTRLTLATARRNAKPPWRW